ncbi:hypothetical protein TSTA_011740 [Talaromyces stipitatus ATCC 10500]|uniref:Uncharacterized protein n=1 Tax=Talaromyces stipitatus (strain ATCC 10500 / CBS 375.48 / QM 6759 / NRRL 1006) TaxID=441959 RepID=B8MDY8_TALSN|nr:uncharacterized protein TSTA_011740 [Talaromyces stipitatus ATCC 10500]EED16065.1 hypothetical protein TSTA_011740 [Talaromyces stipitatus ATCC 10500]
MRIIIDIMAAGFYFLHAYPKDSVLRMELLGVLRLLCLLVASVVATGPVPLQKSGLAGIDGFEFYDFYCAHACYRSFSPFTLSCSNTIEEGGHTTADDLAHDIRASCIEKSWETEITGDVSVTPQWSYGETMSKIVEPPLRVLTGEGMLNETVLTTMAVFTDTENTLIYYFRETALESYFGLAICVAIFALPILLTWMDYLPFMTRVRERLQPQLWPSIIGTYHERPLPYFIGNAPTIGQALFILLMVILNGIFISVDYKTLYPERLMQWYENHYQELMFYVCLRAGASAFCLTPVMFLFSSRNNILLWLID